MGMKIENKFPTKDISLEDLKTKFPLVAKNGGVLERAGHTEASVDISKLAKLNPSAVTVSYTHLTLPTKA